MSSRKDPILIHRKEKRKRKRDATPKKKEEINNPTNADVLLAIAPHLSPIESNGSNLVFSPLSLRTLVSLITAGASGPTLQQLLSFLNSDSLEDLNVHSSGLVSSVVANSSSVGGPNISFANGIWIQESLSLKRSFQQVVENVYKGSCYQVDFVNTQGNEIVSEVNAWAHEKTNGLIQNVLPRGAVNSLTRLILANALYFKGKWLEKYFEVSRTKEYDFHLLAGDSVKKVPFMTSGWRHYIGTHDGFKVLRLPYKQGKHDKGMFSMCIFLPDAKDGLHALVKKIVSEPDFINRHLPYEKVIVNEFRLPRFKISFGFEASAALKQFGLSLPFVPGAGGLTEMVDSGEELFVSDVYQKCFIEVNEQGTEAAAVSRGRLASGCARHLTPPPKVDFVADHPFMFLIREENSGAVLFAGHVLNPLEK